MPRNVLVIAPTDRLFGVDEVREEGQQVQQDGDPVRELQGHAILANTLVASLSERQCSCCHEEVASEDLVPQSDSLLCVGLHDLVGGSHDPVSDVYSNPRGDLPMDYTVIA